MERMRIANQSVSMLRVNVSWLNKEPEQTLKSSELLMLRVPFMKVKRRRLLFQWPRQSTLKVAPRNFIAWMLTTRRMNLLVVNWRRRNPRELGYRKVVLVTALDDVRSLI